MTPTLPTSDSEPDRLNDESHPSAGSPTGNTAGRSFGPRGDSLAPATIETLVRFDEAKDSELRAIESDPRTSAVFNKLRAADAYLESGMMAATASASSSVPAEQLFAFGHGELASSEADAVREHLERTPQEKQWVEALRESPPPATLTWDTIDEPAIARTTSDGQSLSSGGPPPESPIEAERATAPILAGPGSKGLPGWIAWTPLAAAALVLAMAIGGTGPRSVLNGGLPYSPVIRSANSEGLLFPRGRVIAATEGLASYASQPLFEVTPVDGATRYQFVLRDVSAQGIFAEGSTIWESTSPSHQATSMALTVGSYVWSAKARVNGIDRDLGSLSFTVVPAGSVDRALVIRAATLQRTKSPSMLREDIRRLHASGFLTDARRKARSLPAGEDRDAYLASPSAR